MSQQNTLAPSKAQPRGGIENLEQPCGGSLLDSSDPLDVHKWFLDTQHY